MSITAVIAQSPNPVTVQNAGPSYYIAGRNDINSPELSFESHFQLIQCCQQQHRVQILLTIQL